MVARLAGRPARALTLAGAGARFRERFHVLSKDARQRSRVQETIEAARSEAGPEASAHWMRGWNMSPTELLEWATPQGD